MAVWTSLVDAVGNFLGWLFIAPLGAAIEFGRRLYKRTKRNKKRIADIENHLELDEDTPRLAQHDERIEHLEQMSQRQQRALYGDPNDPQDQGMRGEVHAIHDSISEDE